MNRKERRALKKLNKSQEKLSKKVSQFESLPDNCLTCDKSFDKKDKKMAQTWSVVVNEGKAPRLYCPDCWDLANKIISEWKEEIEKNGRKQNFKSWYIKNA